MPTDPCFNWVPLLFLLHTVYCLFCASAITWYKDGRPLTSAAGLTLLKRGQVLEIERAQLSDAGTYRCVAVNLAGDAEISVSLQVYGETYSSSRMKHHQHHPSLHFSSFESWVITLKHLLIFHAVPPVISNRGGTVTVVVNEAARLECEATGVPQPSLTWLKDGSPVASVSHGLQVPTRPYKSICVSKKYRSKS